MNIRIGRFALRRRAPMHTSEPSKTTRPPQQKQRLPSFPHSMKSCRTPQRALAAPAIPPLLRRRITSAPQFNRIPSTILLPAISRPEGMRPLTGEIDRALTSIARYPDTREGTLAAWEGRIEGSRDPYLLSSHAPPSASCRPTPTGVFALVPDPNAWRYLAER